MLTSRPPEAAGEGGYVTSPRAEHVLTLCRIYAKAKRPILLLGPVGAGKTTLARLIHGLSCCAGQFIAVSAGELTETLYADTLFGHVTGAYTGAVAPRQGAFARAVNGTLLLDDLALMSREVQASILRVLEDRSFCPLGGNKEIPATSREIFASTVPPAELVTQGKLLPDLESRLGELVIQVPGLKDRLSELPNLVQEAADAYLGELDRHAPIEFSPLALAILTRHHWPKNLRELRHVVEHCVLHADDDPQARFIRVEPKHLPDRLLGHPDGPSRSELLVGERRLSRQLVEFVLREARGNRSEAARRLGVHRNTINSYLRRT